MLFRAFGNGNREEIPHGGLTRVRAGFDGERLPIEILIVGLVKAPGNDP